MNAYIDTRKETHHLEFKLAGIEPTPWAIEDSLSLAFLLSWNSAANLETEIIAQMLFEAVGIETAREIFPLNINPDDPVGRAENPYALPSAPMSLGLAGDAVLQSYLKYGGPLKLGSNNWAVSGKLSAGGQPVVANDPHLDARILPGPWYPCALITPTLRIVGAGFPGLGGMIVFRNENVALGVTNAYGDAQDLYVETIDPQNPEDYLEGQTAIPLPSWKKRFSSRTRMHPTAGDDTP